MGSVCSSMSNRFSVSEPEIEEQYTTRQRSIARTNPTVSSTKPTVRSTTPMTSSTKPTVRSTTSTASSIKPSARSTRQLKASFSQQPKASRRSVYAEIITGDIKSEQHDTDSFSDEFVPVDEEHLYVDSYWWAQPKDVNEDDVPWNAKHNHTNKNSSPNKIGGVDPIIEDSTIEQDPFSNHPFFNMNIKRLTKPKSTKKRESVESPTKKGSKKSLKENDKEKSKETDLSKFKLVYDDKSVPAIYPQLGDMTMSVDSKCHSIREAFKSDPDDRDRKLIKVYATLSVIDRAYIPDQYKVLFGETLASQIKSAVSGPFGNLILSLSDTIENAEVQMIQTALDSKWTYRNEHLLRIICGRNNEEITKLTETYEKVTGRNLASVVKSELQKGAFRTYMKMCLSKNAVQKYDKKIHNKENAKKVAKEFYDCGEKRFGTDTDEFLGILVRSPSPFLRLVDEAYEKKYKKPITRAIKNELTLVSETAVLYGVGMSLQPFERIAKTMGKSFKGIGMDPIGFNALIVRYHPYLKQIAAAYEDIFRETLIERIHYEAKGSHHDLLCKIIENAINDFGGEEMKEEEK